MTVKESLVKEIKALNEQQLHEVEEYVAFLKFRSRFMSPPSFDENRIAKLYNKFAKEDRDLAEEGMTDYVSSLIKEDGK
jgi:hypothetical protein